MSANEGSSFLRYHGRSGNRSNDDRFGETTPRSLCRASTPWARFAGRPWEDGWRGLPTPEVVCSFQTCIRWPSDRSRWRKSAWRSNPVWCGRTSDRDAYLPDRCWIKFGLNSHGWGSSPDGELGPNLRDPARRSSSPRPRRGEPELHVRCLLEDPRPPKEKSG